jgi:hypothetical protein
LEKIYQSIKNNKTFILIQQSFMAVKAQQQEPNVLCDESIVMGANLFCTESATTGIKDVHLYK